MFETCLGHLSGVMIPLLGSHDPIIPGLMIRIPFGHHIEEDHHHGPMSLMME